GQKLEQLCFDAVPIGSSNRLYRSIVFKAERASKCSARGIERDLQPAQSRSQIPQPPRQHTYLSLKCQPVFTDFERIERQTVFTQGHPQRQCLVRRHQRFQPILDRLLNHLFAPLTGRIECLLQVPYSRSSCSSCASFSFHSRSRLRATKRFSGSVAI